MSDLPDIKSMYIAMNEAIDKHSLNKTFLRLKNVCDITQTKITSTNDIMQSYPMATSDAYGFIKYSSDVIEITGNYSSDDTTVLTPFMLQQYLSAQTGVDYDVPVKIDYSSYEETSAQTYDALQQETSAQAYCNVYSGNIILLNGIKMCYGYTTLSSNNDFSIDDSAKFDNVYITFPLNVFVKKPILYTQIIDCVDSVVDFDDVDIMKPEYRTYVKYINSLDNLGFVFNYKQYHIDLGAMITSDKIVYPGLTVQWLAMGI